MSEVISDSYFDISFTDTSRFAEGTIGRKVKAFAGEANFPDIDHATIVLLGVGEARGNGGEASANTPDLIRSELFRLYPAFPVEHIADIGNLRSGNTPADTYAALAEVLADLIGKGKLPVILGGSQDLTLGNYMAYERLNQTVNLVSIDRCVDFGDTDEGEISASNYLTHLLLRQPNLLFNFSLAGYQTCFTNPEHLQLLEKLYFDAERLGQLRGRMHEAEPIIRNADFMSVDMGAVRYADAPSLTLPSPNGLTGDEICQLMRYAGMSDKLSSLGIYGAEDNGSGLTPALAAQMIWYFLEGVHQRKHDFPVADKEEYQRFRVVLKDQENEIVFYKSGRSERWWMDVPYPAGNRFRFQRHHMVPCTYEDYLTACRDEMPDRWWKTWQKLS